MHVASADRGRDGIRTSSTRRRRTATTELCSNLGFVVTTTFANSSTVAAGLVISQSTPGGQQATAGSTIALVVSLGPPQVAVPNVVGATLAGATTALNGVGSGADDHDRRERHRRRLVT